MNLQFTKEVTIKKDIYELDMKNEDLAFKLFSKQLQVTKNRNKGLSFQQIEQEAKDLKSEIESNYRQKAHFSQTLAELESQRERRVEEY